MDSTTGPRIGSLFSGYGGLDMAVQDVLGGTVVWHSQYEPPDKHGKVDTHQYAAQILHHHWPHVPNLGDITAVDWGAVLDEYGPIDILTGGFPCTDVSLAGLRAGLAEGTRSGLWSHMAIAIQHLQPRLVVIENVEGLLSTEADRGLEPGAEDLDEGPAAGRVLRALGAVLGDLAALGFDAEWTRLGASDIGAPHQRKRIIISAWPADAEGRAWPWLRGRPAEHGAATSDADGLGSQRDRALGGRRDEPAAHGLATAHPGGRGRGTAEPDLLQGQPDARWLAPADTEGCPGRIGHGDDVRAGGAAVGRDAPAGRGAASDPTGLGHGNAGPQGVGGLPAAAVAGRPAASPADADRDALRQQPVAVCRRSSPAIVGLAGTEADADPARLGRGEGGAEPARQQGRPDPALSGGEPVADPDSGRFPEQPERDSEPYRGEADDLRDVPDAVRRDDAPAWGPYAAAVGRWEHILGRAAPRATDDRGRLNPVFVEWMMGLPVGHVTGVPGLPRTAQLKALGNGVVPAQAAAALRLLFARLEGIAS